MTPTDPVVTILIVSYNTRDLTLACLQSVFDSALDRAFEVVVIDNASTDASADEIEKRFPLVRLMRSSCNHGFARANNLASQCATGRYILLLNPDTVVLDHAIDQLVAFADSNPEAGIWGGRTVFEDGSLNPTSCWRFMSLWSLISFAVGLTYCFPSSSFANPEAYAGWRRDRVRQVDIVTGCFLLIKRDLWDGLGGFDERFFMYAEEADLCYRACQQGFRPLFTPEATIIHYGGASETQYSVKIGKLFSGKICFLVKHWTQPKRKTAIVLFKVGTLIRAIGYTAASMLSRAQKHKTAAREWRAVWSMRRQWERGYQAAPE